MVMRTLADVKDFVIYTLMRVLLFVATAAIVFAIWALVADSVPIVWVIVVAFIISGIGSFFLLNPQREALAKRVEGPASKVGERYERMRSSEDEQG